MRITIESTSQIVDLNGVPARIWEGHTETGIPVHAFLTRIAVAQEADEAQFQRELTECRAPSREVRPYPGRMVL